MKLKNKEIADVYEDIHLARSEAVYSNEEIDRINLIAERKFAVKRHSYPTRSLIMDMICLERNDELEIADHDAYDIDYVFDESDNDDNNADDLNAANDVLNGRKTALDPANSSCHIQNPRTVFILIFIFVFLCSLSFLLTFKFALYIIRLFLPDIIIILVTEVILPFLMTIFLVSLLLVTICNN